MEETSREAVATAVQRVAGMLQRSDQLDKVEQYRRREARKKASVEARLKVQELSDELAKQLWMVLQRAIVTVRRDPTMLVSVVRIIEREEKIDRRMVDRKKQTGFIPPGRPKRWKDKMFQVLEGTVGTRIEGTQSVTREADKIEEMMGHAELYSECDINQLEPLLPQDVVDELLSKYVQTFTSDPGYRTGAPDPLVDPACLQSNITGWLRKALETDKKDWQKETEPEADQDGYYQTTLPAIVFQMFEQNLQVAAQIDGEFKEQVLKLCLKQMNTFLVRYREEAMTYKEEHLRDRQLPQCYIQYMIAIINNCQTFKESINSLKRKYSQASEPTDSDAAIERTLSDVAKEGCQFLLDEVFLDLEEMTSEALRRVVVEYIKAVMQKRITFKNADERREGAERMIKEAEQFKFLFRKLAAGEDTDRLCGAIAAIAEVFKLTDPTLLFLEVTTLVSKYPDIREEHIQALLAVRGDASREMRQMIIGTLSENKVSYSGLTQPIFKDITVPTMTMTTMNTMTSMATAKLLK
ncbi:Exocyst complex component 3 [Liparis tanakae]|uniref:Exocyst complex component 3 n=1 Tax=Liparis tanakae TaxID=230148 RepID=A0A4Z2FQJ7_9TELE|nr:Exocyst complex component 3 [Liparis tanakae]